MPPVHNLTRLSDLDRQVLAAITSRPGTFTAGDVASDSGLLWWDVRNSLVTLLGAGKVWRAAESWDRYTMVAALQRRRPEKVGRAATMQTYRECRVVRRKEA